MSFTAYNTGTKQVENSHIWVQKVPDHTQQMQNISLVAVVVAFIDTKRSRLTYES